MDNTNPESSVEEDSEYDIAKRYAAVCTCSTHLVPCGFAFSPIFHKDPMCPNHYIMSSDEFYNDMLERYARKFSTKKIEITKKWYEIWK